MPQNARLTDMWTGVCCCHQDPPCVGMSGMIITASSDTTTEGLAQARAFDITIGYCGHTGFISRGSSLADTNGRDDARVGDPVVGCNIGVIVSGASTAITGG